MHAVDARVVVAKALAADKFAAWCAQLPPGCLVALEACGGAHHWARKLRGYGLDARLIAGHFVTPYRMAGKGRKNGAADAAAICEAATRPHMRFVPVKPPAQTLLTSHQLSGTTRFRIRSWSIRGTPSSRSAPALSAVRTFTCSTASCRK
ncbi:hypothetical protein HMPREF0004_4885 [Achromobacter piechaudii ATCC 43553]|uniref:Transposase n=1 Tax=Achromobacter piechaudii ATCC 43553 TaxID=742159 RepID=D4XHD8_9BURK|nr:hypothetical protein HMPREF0004_4885 [Achromobacter piechaudii ATCC 43553]